MKKKRDYLLAASFSSIGILACVFCSPFSSGTHAVLGHALASLFTFGMPIALFWVTLPFSKPQSDLEDLEKFDKKAKKQARKQSPKEDHKASNTVTPAFSNKSQTKPEAKAERPTRYKRVSYAGMCK